MRPPSSGKAGTRLKIRTRRLMLPSQLISAAIPEVRVSPWVRTACLNSWLPASARPAIAQATTIASSDQRTGDRDLELGPGGVRVLLEPGEAAEQPQRDRGDADVVAPGHEGVAELVEQDRAEEEHGARDRKQIRRGVTRGGVEDVAVEAGEPEDDQEEDHEPGVVHRDPDAPDAKQCDATAGHASDVREGELAFRHGHGGSQGISAPPDAAWMRKRLEELCSYERGSASEGERRAAEWLAG